MQSQGAKEVGEEQATMAQEVTKEGVYQFGGLEDCLLANLENGKAIMDSWRIPNDCWRRWLDVMPEMISKNVVMRSNVCDFRFGDGVEPMRLTFRLM